MTARCVPPAERAAIEELNARFAWALDLGEFDNLRQVFTSEARYVSGERIYAGVDAIVSRFTARTGPRTTRHGWSSLTLQATGDKIYGLSSWYTFAANQDAPISGTGVYLVADFVDIYVSIADVGWRIAERTIHPVFKDERLAPT
ncbi:hypothetical protein FHX82_005819 [Amycolatopsis bartoniae]|uniref:SnoaL-like domain-containing protein n=1 Tax=Amycolatopsis bartoniae TaxID=941986 RepID=A0A8H9J3E6_9PSEU|nr:nuclear transport factor 2 family protein [Amycolatopsis bartoniae]MBB2938741.1 hypothetical protein [Amycolatopsis bartoniae]TVT11480.1 hypothetical protein FNH07_01245 [Amycolatopsis bartoniae]GHF79829.1 hypothetical protein GCM10017566_62550 [Amycolatopsis bartoniae]